MSMDIDNLQSAVLWFDIKPSPMCTCMFVYLVVHMHAIVQVSVSVEKHVERYMAKSYYPGTMGKV